MTHSLQPASCAVNVESASDATCCESDTHGFRLTQACQLSAGRYKDGLLRMELREVSD